MTEKTNINNNIIIPNKSFYYKEEFSNDWSSYPCAYSLDIEIEKHYCDLLKFNLDRIIYSSNDFTFRERTKKNDGKLNLPYMNYYRVGYSEADRPWWNNYANAFGLMDVGNNLYYKDVGSLIRIEPIKIEYEATIFFSQQKDCEYAFSQLLLASGNETILYPTLTVKSGKDELLLKNIAIETCHLEFNPTYNESDWLINNKIWTISIDIDYDTFLVFADKNEVYIANNVMLDFLIAKKLTKSNIDNSEIIVKLEEYFNK